MKDLTDAYYRVPIENSLQFFFPFQFQEKFYKYSCLPNDLTSVPSNFTKIMKPVLSALRKLGYNVANYLVNIFICGDTFGEFRDAELGRVNLLSKLGFSIHTEKSQQIPLQKTEYIGFHIDSLTKTKQDDLKSLIAEVSNSSKLRMRDISKVLGSFEAALPANTNGRLYMFYSQKLEND